MKVFVKPQAAPEAKTKNAGIVALFLAGIMTAMLVAQLFTLEEFTPIASTFDLPGLTGEAFTFLITLLALLSLPFLLRMDLSVAFRYLSAACLVGFVALWGYAASVVVFSRPGLVESIGFAGGIGTLTPGPWAICIVVALGVLSAWSLWGLWPARNPR